MRPGMLREAAAAPEPRAPFLRPIRAGLWTAAILLFLAPPSLAAGEGTPALEELDWVIESALSQPHLAGARLGLVVESLDTGTTLYERSADEPMIPASNMKIVTGAAALSVLGPDFSFETTVATDAPSPAPILLGNLYVKGSGDPSLVSEELWKLVEEIRVLGIDRIEGDLVLDASYFDDSTTASSDVADGDRAYHARTGALSLNFNAIAVHVSPGGGPGSDAIVELAPGTAFAKLLNEATTGRAGSRSTVSVRRTAESGSNVVTVTGRVPAGSPKRTFYRNLEDGLGYFGAVMREFMEAEGIELTGKVAAGSVPDGATVLFAHRSKPLALIVRDLNKFSNNFVAEQLLKTMGARAGGPPGSTRGGVEVMEDFLRSAGADSGAFHIADGSGFSRENRLTPRLLAGIIRRELEDFESSYEFAASLSVSGTDGTLEDRMGFPGLVGAVRAKTGLLDGVTAISGIMRTAGGEDLLFSLIVNGFECEAWRVHDLEHAILSVMARG